VRKVYPGSKNEITKELWLEREKEDPNESKEMYEADASTFDSGANLGFDESCSGPAKVRV